MAMFNPAATLGTAAALNVGTSADNVVKLDGSARLPAVDGSQLTSVPSVGVSVFNPALANGNNLFVGLGSGNAGVGNTTMSPSGGAAILASNNTLVGTSNGTRITTGRDNTLLGNQVGNQLTTGLGNTFVGQAVGNLSTTITTSTLIGSLCGQANMTGSANVVIGYNTGALMNSAAGCTVVGSASGNALTTSFGSTIVGNGISGGSGSTNTLIGYQTAGGLTTGAGNTIIGASLSGLASGLANTLIVGSGGAQRLAADATSFRPSGPIKSVSVAVASLPAAATVGFGTIHFATNGRKAGEGSGAGTGVPVWSDGTSWRTFYDNAAVAA